MKDHDGKITITGVPDDCERILLMLWFAKNYDHNVALLGVKNALSKEDLKMCGPTGGPRNATTLVSNKMMKRTKKKKRRRKPKKPALSNTKVMNQKFELLALKRKMGKNAIVM